MRITESKTYHQRFDYGAVDALILEVQTPNTKGMIEVFREFLDMLERLGEEHIKLVAIEKRMEIGDVSKTVRIGFAATPIMMEAFTKGKV